jgi:hypothetical protein
VCFYKVENPLLEVVKHADLHCVKKVRLREGTHNAGNVSKHVESAVNVARQQFGNGYLVGGIAELSIYVVIPAWVFLVRRVIITKCVLWTLAPKTDIPLEML